MYKNKYLKYKNKYLKYKNKYLKLKYGGSNSSDDEDVQKLIEILEDNIGKIPHKELAEKIHNTNFQKYSTLNESRALNNCIMTKLWKSKCRSKSETPSLRVSIETAKAQRTKPMNSINKNINSDNLNNAQNNIIATIQKNIKSNAETDVINEIITQFDILRKLIE